MEFEEWPKTARLFADAGITISEKIDGTNSAIIIEEHDPGDWRRSLTWFRDQATGELGYHTQNPLTWDETDLGYVLGVVPGPGKMDNDSKPVVEYWIGAQSRTRTLTVGTDNHGFARWVRDNARSLVYDLGEGRHFGEWWGEGIGRKYGQTEKFFSLFNTYRHRDGEGFTTPNFRVVPVLYQGPFAQLMVDHCLDWLDREGSQAAPGFHNPEGICIYHRASDTVFKTTLGGDGQKGGQR